MGPLVDLRVVEIAEEIAGPYCGKLLADLGATVIKVEPPDGDAMRRWGPFPDQAVDPERSGLFHHLNAGKQGIALDLHDATERDTVLSLVAGADVVVETLGVDGLDRHGLGPDVLAAANPDAVVVRVSPFGQTGPSRSLESTGFTLQQNANLLSPLNWLAVTNSVNDDGLTKSILVDPPAALLVPSGDIAAIATAILQLLSDDVLRETLRQRGRARAFAAYDRAVLLARVEALYTSLLGTTR